VWSREASATMKNFITLTKARMRLGQ